MNRTAFIISIALTTFVLMAVGGIVYAVNRTEKAQAAQAEAAPVDLAAATIDPALEQAINEREAAYQAMIAEANTRLEQAQKQQLELQSQVAALQSAAQPAQAPTSVTPEEAAVIASDFLGQTSVYSVESITYQGATLFQVTFSSGDIVYISLDGQVAGSVAATQLTSASVPAPRGRSGGGEHHDDHDGGHDDD